LNAHGKHVALQRSTRVQRSLVENFIFLSSAWNLELYCKILNENIQRCRSDNQFEGSTAKCQHFFGPIFFKSIKF